MKKGYLGDALDLAKGVVLSALPDVCRSRLAVAPMCTDLADWSQPDRETYRKLLELPEEAVVLWEPDAYAARRFGTLSLDVRAVFLDPNTGVARRRGANHVSVPEVEGVLAEGAPRVVVLYQHRWRDGAYLLPILGWFARPNFAYDAGAVAFVYVANDADLLETCRSALAVSLGAAAGRVTPLLSPKP